PLVGCTPCCMTIGAWAPWLPWCRDQMVMDEGRLRCCPDLDWVCCDRWSRRRICWSTGCACSEEEAKGEGRNGMRLDDLLPAFCCSWVDLP
ncbi:hypothetical protein ACLOJK_006789, partial [Asimina triloba]